MTAIHKKTKRNEIQYGNSILNAKNKKSDT